MRTELVECKCHKTARRRCPWAATVAKVEGGYLCFESHIEYLSWRAQK